MINVSLDKKASEYVLNYLKEPSSKSYDYIYNEESWNASYNDGALKLYYAKYPDEDRYNTKEDRVALASDKVDGEWPDYCPHCWKGAYMAVGAKFPWITPYFDYNVNAILKFKYEGKEDVLPWGEKVFGEDRMFGVASVAEEFKDKGFLIPENKDNGDPSWSGEVGANDFDINKFKLILIKQ